MPGSGHARIKMMVGIRMADGRHSIIHPLILSRYTEDLCKKNTYVCYTYTKRNHIYIGISLPRLDLSFTIQSKKKI